ncbi:hypothetical protein ACFY15_16525 [Streptomyces sp. NPDC001373]|uniref:hypothetical protein n=1 Tax=Streptomyces sp. NPDC001373 TaxID=3364565 RepID=UPI0036838A01
MLTEIDKLLAVRAIGLPADLFADVAPKVVAGWRARAAVESPSHLRTHPLRMTLLAALLHEREREREITDTLVELLISTVHRIGARAAWPARLHLTWARMPGPRTEAETNQSTTARGHADA